MSTHYQADLLHIGRKTELLFLAFSSCAGAVLGVAIAYNMEPYFFSMMRMAASGHVSIVGLLLVIIFPFLISAIAVYLSKPYLFLPLSFFKCCVYSLVLCGICIEFSSAGWLVCMFLLFSDTFTILALHFFWIRYLHGFRKFAFKELLITLSASLCFCFLDYIWVSPFLFTLMNA